MSKEVKENMKIIYNQIQNVNKEIETIKKIVILELSSIITEMKILLREGFTEERISKLEYKSIEINKFEKQRRKE